MKYDFSSLIDRHGMDSIAVDSWGEIPGMAPNAPDEGFDRIPMWVADMNFATVPTVQEHIIQRAQHPMFGYFNPRAEYFDRIIEWQSRRNGVEGLRPEHIGYENGVLGGVVSTLRAYVQPGDAVLVHSPTYIGFTKSIEAAGYRIVHSPLKLDDQGVWRMDFEDMEHKLAQNHIHAAVFCSPHNPCGRVWERDEIERAMDIYRQHDCVVISDEIWSDIILPGHKHIPTQSVSEDARMRTVALYAPSKTFNLAGLVGSYHIIYNETLRDRMCAVSNKTHYNEIMSSPCTRLSVPTSRRATSGWTSSTRCLPAISSTSAITWTSILRACLIRVRRARTWCFWTAPSGAASMAAIFSGCSTRGRAWAWGIRTAARSTDPATFA